MFSSDHHLTHNISTREKAVCKFHKSKHEYLKVKYESGFIVSFYIQNKLLPFGKLTPQSYKYD